MYPEAEVQLCIIHQIRNSLRYVSWKDRKEFMKDLKEIYKSISKERAEESLRNFEKKWNKKYPIV